MDHRRTFSDQMELLRIVFPRSDHVRAAQAMRAAINSAYTKLPLAHEWVHLRRVAMIGTAAPYSTGTITSANGVVTLDGGIWPTWAADGQLLVGSDRYDLQQRLSATEVRVNTNQHPGVQFDDDTYTLMRPRYLLPSDFGQVVGAFRQGGRVKIEHVGERFWPDTATCPSNPGVPGRYTIQGPRGGTLYIELFPPPSAAEEILLYYRAYCRPLAQSLGFETGTISITGRTVIASTGVVFPTTAAGMVLRVSDNTKPPTGKFGLNPYTAAYTIIQREADDELVLSEDAETVEDVKYTLEDPIDIDPASMGQYFDRACEAELCRLVPVDSRSEFEGAAKSALQRAKGYDHRPANLEVAPADFGVSTWGG